MKVTILGSGTSSGIPVVGCSCPVCTSSNIRNKRTRASIWVETEEASILVDTSTDFRMQALREGIDSLDAVCFTHPHADHLHGLDDTRSLTWEKPLPLYASPTTEAEIRTRFEYLFRKTQIGGGKPDVFFKTIGTEPFEIAGLVVHPIPVLHGKLPILGFRFGSLAYITDCSFIPEESFRRLAGTRTLIIGALRDKPHITHFTVSEAIRAAQRIGADQTILTHISHELEHEELSNRLPDGFVPAYDGLSIGISEETEGTGTT